MDTSYIYISEVADLLDVHRDTVKKYAEDGLLPVKRDWRGWRVFDLEDVLSLKARKDKYYTKARGSSEQFECLQAGGVR